jgi:hypothetical protein
MMRPAFFQYLSFPFLLATPETLVISSDETVLSDPYFSHLLVLVEGPSFHQALKR